MCKCVDVSDLLIKWSTNRHPDCVNYVNFAEEPFIQLKLWTSAYQWALENKKVLERKLKDNSIQFYTTSSTMKTAINTKIVQKYEKFHGKWTSFEDFRKQNYGVWIITVNPSTMTATCTCPKFLKSEQCKHSIGILIREKHVQAPMEARSTPLGQKRKRGRPRKAVRALLTQ